MKLYKNYYYDPCRKMFIKIVFNKDEKMVSFPRVRPFKHLPKFIVAVSIIALTLFVIGCDYNNEVEKYIPSNDWEKARYETIELKNFIYLNKKLFN
jgi:hypothetical protein